MRGKTQPTAKRSERCPDCGLYYAPAGLIGHQMFVHKKRFTRTSQHEDKADSAYRIVRQKKVVALMERAADETEKTGRVSGETLASIQEMMLIDYLFGRGLFRREG